MEGSSSKASYLRLSSSETCTVISALSDLGDSRASSKQQRNIYDDYISKLHAIKMTVEHENIRSEWIKNIKYTFL